MAVLATAASALLRWALPEVLSGAPYLGFYPAVVVAAALGGVRPGLVATFGSLLFVNLVFVQLDLTNHGLQMRNLIWIVGSTGVSLLAGRLSDTRREAEARAAAARSAEQDMRESEARYRRLLEAIPVPVGVVNRNQQSIFFNQRFTELFGYTLADLPTLEAWWRRAYPDPEYRRRVTENWQAKVQRSAETRTETEPEELTVTCKDGSTRVVVISNLAMEDGILAAFTDITERKRAELDLEQARLMLTEAERLGHLGSWQWKARTGETVWSEEQFRIYGLEPGSRSPSYDELMANHFHPEDAATQDRTFREAVRTRSIFEIDLRIIRPDGTVRFVHNRALPQFDANGELLGYVGAALDLTERKQVEEALHASHDRLAAAHNQIQTLINNTPAIVYAFDLEGRFVMANKALAELLQSAPEQMIGKKRHEFMPRTDAEWHEANDRRVMEAGTALEFEEHSQIDGRSITWLTTKFPLRDPQGKTYAVAGISTNISERKRIEGEIAAHRDLLETVFEHMPAAINIIRGRDLRLMMVNAGYRAIAPGKSGFVGKTLDELWPETGQDFAALCRRVLETGEPHHVVDELNMIRRHPDGPLEKAWFTWSLYRIRLPGDDGWGIFNPAWETTARMEAAEALRTSEERLRLAQQVARIGSFEFNPQTKLSHWSPELEALYGLPTGGYSGKYEDWAARVHPDDLPQAERSLRDAMVTGSFEAAWRVVRPDGAIRWLAGRGKLFKDDTGKPVRMIGVNLDITESKEAEAALRQSERLYRGIGESIDYGIWICDAQGRNIYASESLLKLVGITQEQCKDFGWGSVLHPDDANATMEAWKQCVQTGGPWYREHRYLGVDGQYHPILACGVAVRDEGGQVTHWAGINLDISRLKQAEQAIRGSLREKEVLLREIHHRVKNNMQVISSLVDLQADALANSAVREPFAEIRDRVRSMALVHEQLYQSESLAEVNFAEYTQSLLTYLWNSYGGLLADVELKLDLQPVSLTIDTAIPCGLLLNELATNALKHAFRNRSAGELSISLHVRSDQLICLTVSDNGAGLPSGLNWRKTHSMGLQLVRTLVKQLKAEVKVSTSGGTRFEIVFAPQPTTPKQ